MATRTVQQDKVSGMVDERFDVIVDGRKVGEVVRNKHRMWWGHWDMETGYTVASLDGIGVRHADGTFAGASRRKGEVVAAVVAQRRLN